MGEAIDRNVLKDLADLQEEGEPDIVEDIGGIFLAHAPAKIDAIAEAASKGDLKVLERAAHSLKSSSAYVGAMRLSAMCRELEERARSGSVDEPAAKAELLRQEFLRAKAELEQEIQRRKVNARRS
ncbi:MAG: Hpt domain-containing protein [Methanotrichaceae archaeon]|nr:Hpt domain-containing protein [Methanotrichaceae archaeon]